jgi:hypothetical protein
MNLATRMETAYCRELLQLGNRVIQECHGVYHLPAQNVNKSVWRVGAVAQPRPDRSALAGV